MFGLISKVLVDYNGDNFKNVLTKIKSPIKYTYFGYVSQNKEQSKYIANAFKDLVMNDKEKSNYLNLPYFIPFLASFDEAFFKEAIYPEIDFMMKRGVSVVSIISSTIKALNFKFTPDIVAMLTSPLFNEEYIIKEESASDIRNYFSVISGKIETKEVA